jgi:NTP pyrophosphatase (non-canonical NTP hydrolase)
VRPEEDREERTGARVRSELAELVYELLDAHDDTASLAAGLGDVAWMIHLDYLRALQRRGREILARLPFEDSVR